MVSAGLTLTYQKEPLVVCSEYWDHFKMESTANNSMIYYLEGDGDAIINNQFYRISSNSVLLVPKESQIRFSLINRKQTGKIVSVILRDGLVWDYLQSLGKMLDVLKVLDTVQKVDSTLTTHFFHSLILYSSNKVFLREDFLKNRIFEIMHLIEKHAATGNQTMYEPLDDSCRPKILSQLSEVLTTKKSIPQIARGMGVSTSTLTRRFRQEFNVSISQWLISKRLERARFFLLHSGKSIKEIAFECGFCSPSYMIKTYKRKYGYTPMEDLSRMTQAQ